MRNQIVLCLVIVFCLAGSLHADMTWMGPTTMNGGQWSNPDHWGGALPTAADKIYFNGPTTCILDFDAGTVRQFDHAGGPLKIVD